MALLATTGLSKFYPGVRALDGVDFDLRAGEVHVLFGENGAGKSTLISLISGASQPSSGVLQINGQAVHPRSVREARELGISAVFQEFSLIPTLSVAENLLLGDEPRSAGFLDRRAMKRRARELLDDLEFDIDPNAQVSFLSRAQQQMVEIAKSLRGKLSVLILDEPTASLSDKEARRLFSLIDRLKRDGIGIIYISHRMQEITEIAERITVLRDGKKIATVDAKTTDHSTLIKMMAGRTVEQIYPKIESKPGRLMLEVDKLSTRGGVREASVHVRAGEVLGIAGLVGSGKSELFRAIYGLDRITSGRVRFDDKDRTGARTVSLLREGFFYLPPDRKSEGLILDFSSDSNIALPVLGTLLRGAFGLLKQGDRGRITRAAGARVELANRNASKRVGLLSGGNQQKVLFAKGLTNDAKLYVFDEPTVGVDVGTRSALYRLIQSLCEGGAAVVVISSDLPEILHLSHRAYVMRAGRVAGEFHGDQITESALLGLFFDGGHVDRQLELSE